MFSYTAFEDVLDRLADDPVLHVFPLAMTKYRRRVQAIRTGSGPRQVILTAAHHANEWITALVLLQFLAKQLPQPAWQNQATVYFLPLINPDGVELVTGALPPDSPQYRDAQAIAARYPQIPFPGGWKANGAGVDLNLNYPAGFPQAVLIKSILGFSGPAPCNWPGASPLDQPESASLAELTRRVSPDLVLALHTQGQEIYWSYQDYHSAEAEQLGRRMAAASGYTLCTPPPNSSHAGYKDWFEARFRRPGYTIEAGLGENPLPVDQLDEICRQVFPILELAISG